jgi:elongation factor P hydroxylase
VGWICLVQGKVQCRDVASTQMNTAFQKVRAISFVAEWLICYKAGMYSSEVVNQLMGLVHPQQLLNPFSIQSIC